MSERCFGRTPGGRVTARCGQLPEQVAAEHGWEIVFVGVGSADSSARVVRAFMGCTARVLRAEFRQLCRFAKVAKVLWSPSYFVGPVGSVSESTVRRYLEHQWDEVAS